MIIRLSNFRAVPDAPATANAEPKINAVSQMIGISSSK
jgi:hypothetical protein